MRFYEILGLSRDATPEQINARCTELMRDPNLDPSMCYAIYILNQPGTRLLYNLLIAKHEANIKTSNIYDLFIDAILTNDMGYLQYLLENVFDKHFDFAVFTQRFSTKIPLEDKQKRKDFLGLMIQLPRHPLMSEIFYNLLKLDYSQISEDILNLAKAQLENNGDYLFAALANWLRQHQMKKFRNMVSQWVIENNSAFLLNYSGFKELHLLLKPYVEPAAAPVIPKAKPKPTKWHALSGEKVRDPKTHRSKPKAFDSNAIPTKMQRIANSPASSMKPAAKGNKKVSREPARSSAAEVQTQTLAPEREIPATQWHVLGESEVKGLMKQKSRLPIETSDSNSELKEGSAPPRSVANGSSSFFHPKHNVDPATNPSISEDQIQNSILQGETPRDLNRMAIRFLLS